MLAHYCIADYEDVQEFLSHIAHKTGRLRKGKEWAKGGLRV